MKKSDWIFLVSGNFFANKTRMTLRPHEVEEKEEEQEEEKEEEQEEEKDRKFNSSFWPAAP